MPLFVRTLLVTGPRDEVEAASQKHRDHLLELHGRGKLRAAGELSDAAGFLEIFDAEDRVEAERIARLSPLVEEGLGTWMLREWRELSFD
jgi:uncharacterized protein YciI